MIQLNKLNILELVRQTNQIPDELVRQTNQIPNELVRQIRLVRQTNYSPDELVRQTNYSLDNSVDNQNQLDKLTIALMIRQINKIVKILTIAAYFDQIIRLLIF